MTANNFYPTLSNLIPIEYIPEDAAFFKDGLTQIFDHFFYKDLNVSHSVEGDSASYALKIVTYKPIILEIPGTNGLALIINKDASVGNGAPAFPVALSYKWYILKYIKDFDVSSFDYTARSLFDLALDISGCSKVDFLQEAISLFIQDPDPIQVFVNDFYSTYTPNPVLLKSNDPDITVVIEDLISQINYLYSNNIIQDDFTTVAFNYFLNNPDVIANCETLFQRWLGYFKMDNIKELLIPKISASLTLNFGIQFPLSILRQVNADGDLIDDSGALVSEENATHVFMSCAGGSIYYRTQRGMYFDANYAFTIQNYAEIKGTGLYFSFTDVKLDLSRTENIPEAIADGRPVDFIGVYVTDATIFSSRVGVPPMHLHFPPTENKPNQLKNFKSNFLISKKHFFSC